MYKVVKAFRDLKDDKHPYKVGDEYPREGFEPSEERLKELSSKDNKIGKVLIVDPENPLKEEKNDKDEFPKHVGGGNYELSNGEKVKGKEKAHEAQKALEE